MIPAVVYGGGKETVAVESAVIELLSSCFRTAASRASLSQELVALLAGSAAQADILLSRDPLEIDMGFYRQIHQTAVWSASIGAIDLATVSGVRVRDLGWKGSSDGVFSGFDVDIVVFDIDGDITTTYDQIRPLAGPATYLQPGSRRNAAKSIYQPTASHPGSLFGLRGDGTIDHNVATLGTLDGVYVYENLRVDSSDGFVTVGDGGALNVAFPLFSIAPEQRVTLFVGDAGVSDEAMSASVAIEFADAPQAQTIGKDILAVGSSVAPGGSVLLTSNVQPSCDPFGPVAWRWDLDGDGLFDDAVGEQLALTYDRLTGPLGLSPGEHTVWMEVSGGCNATQRYQTQITILTPAPVIPEPMTAGLLGLGSLSLVLRRRR